MTGSNSFSIDTFDSLIKEAYKGLTANQKKVAQFVQSDMNEAAFLSVVELGNKCGVSKATVVRFAQRIGFDGYYEFRNALQAAVQKKYSYMERFPLVAESDKDTFIKVARQDVENINQTMESIRISDFNDVIDTLSKARNINTFGKGISGLMAKILAYSLSQVAIKSRAVISDHLTFEEELMFIDHNDALVFFSFPPYSKESIAAAKLAHEKNIPVISLTDTSTSPICEYSNKALYIKSENLLFTNSFAAISVVINAITTEISIRNKKGTLQFISKVNDLMHKGGHFE